MASPRWLLAAAALYTPSMLATLREDFARIPGLLEREVPGQTAPSPVASAAAPLTSPSQVGDEPDEEGQLGLF